MNERIRELAKQAGDYVNEVYTPPVRSKTPSGKIWEDGHIGWHEQFHEMFTELLIRECLVQIGDAIPDTNCSASGVYKTAKLAAMNRVKEHFGVEE